MTEPDEVAEKILKQWSRWGIHKRVLDYVHNQAIDQAVSVCRELDGNDRTRAKAIAKLKR